MKFEKNDSKAEEVRELPSIDHGHEEVPLLKMGESIQLESMGPIIINPDGTQRRISNWDELSEHEKEVSWRRIKERNKERLKILKE